MFVSLKVNEAITVQIDRDVGLCRKSKALKVTDMIEVWVF